MISTPDIEYKTEVTNFVNFQGPKTNFEGSPTYSGFFLFTQISGHVPIKILEVLNISKLQDNFCIYWCEFHLHLIYHVYTHKV